MASGWVVEALGELGLLFGLLIMKRKMGWHLPRQCPWADPRVEGLRSELWVLSVLQVYPHGCSMSIKALPSPFTGYQGQIRLQRETTAE